MSSISFGRYYGLRKPFDFTIAIPFLLNVCGVVAVLLSYALLAAAGAVDFGTIRFAFFCYLAIAFLIAIVISRIRWLSYSIFLWCTIELGLAFASSILPQRGVGAYLLPQNRPIQSSTRGHIHHPLLQYVPRPNWRSASGKVFHNALGIRGFELQPADLNKEFIFVYGGSTTYDADVMQGETWVELMQAHLDNKFTLFNLGLGGYSTTEHLIQTAFYQSNFGKEPLCAIYYVGWNDIINSHIENVDRAYAERLVHQLNGVRKPTPAVVMHSPLLRVLYDIVSEQVDSMPREPQFNSEPISRSNERLEGIFSEHVSTITAINNARGVTTVFIGQIMNRARLTSEGVSGFFPFIRRTSVWPIQERFNQILRNSALASGARYVDAGIENFFDEDFVDEGHFSTAGSRKFAQLVSSPVRGYCLPPAVPANGVRY